MPLSKPLTRLGPLGVFALAGLSACATWPTYRTPQGPNGAAPAVVVSSSPPMGSVPVNSDAATSLPPGEPSVAPSISVPGPLATVPVARPDADSGPNGPGASPLPPPAPAPPAAPPALPEPARSTDVTPSEATSPAAESNRNQLGPQKPLDVTSPNSDQSGPGPQTNGGPSPGQASTVQIGVAASTVATSPANPPVGALAKLRARFHALTHSSAKPASKPSKAAKSHDPTAPASEPPQAVASVRISLPMSDANGVAKEDPRTLHGLYPGEEDPGPVSTADAHGPQTGAPPAEPAAAQENGDFGHGTIERSAGTEQIEQWPYGPQAAANVPKASNGPAPTNDFDPIPVEEYQAAVARVNDGSTSVPAFHQASQAPNDGLHAANVAPPTEATPATSPLATRPIPAPPESPALETRGVPTVDAPPAQNDAPVTRIEQADSPKRVEEPSDSSQRVGLQEPAEPERSPQVVLPAPPQADVPLSAGTPSPTAPPLQKPATPPPPMPAALVIIPAEQRPHPLPAVRSPQWIGGRYGQPAWMAAPNATPVVPRGN